MIEWNDGSIRPAVDGMYLRKFRFSPPNETHWARFERGWWYAADSDYETAKAETMFSPVQYSPMWAGCGETDWIDGYIKPVRDGVYKRLTIGGDGVWAKFEKGVWYMACSDYETARTEWMPSLYQDLFPWKGIHHAI